MTFIKMRVSKQLKQLNTCLKLHSQIVKHEGKHSDIFYDIFTCELLQPVLPYTH